MLSFLCLSSLLFSFQPRYVRLSSMFPLFCLISTSILLASPCFLLIFGGKWRQAKIEAVQALGDKADLFRFCKHYYSIIKHSLFNRNHYFRAKSTRNSTAQCFQGCHNVIFREIYNFSMANHTSFQRNVTISRTTTTT